MLLTGLLALICAGFGGGVLWFRGRRSRDNELPDAGVSTLVFPPESRFPASVSSRR